MLFVPIKFKTTVQLYPVEMDVHYQERLVEKIKTEYEGVCSKFGYIRPNSIEIIKRSCGLLQKAYFNGSIRFEMLCRAEVCNPIQGSMVEAVVKNKNQLGILAESYVDDEHKMPILDIIIPVRSAGIVSQVNLETIQIGDTIHVEVLGKKYQMKDRKISIIGRAVISDIKKEPLIISEEEEVDPALEEEIYEDIDDTDVEAKKEGGGDEEEEEEEENSDDEEEDSDNDSLEGGDSEFDVGSEDLQEDGGYEEELPMDD